MELIADKTQERKRVFRKANKVSLYKKRMLVWDSPVEYVNNMYGCHPNEIKMEYIDTIYEQN